MRDYFGIIGTGFLASVAVFFVAYILMCFMTWRIHYVDLLALRVFMTVGIVLGNIVYLVDKISE